MNVIMRATITGTRNGEDWPPVGGQIELPDTEAVALLNAGLASAAGARVETAAVVEPAETATRNRRRKS